MKTAKPSESDWALEKLAALTFGWSDTEFVQNLLICREDVPRLRSAIYAAKTKISDKFARIPT